MPKIEINKTIWKCDQCGVEAESRKEPPLDWLTIDITVQKSGANSLAGARYDGATAYLCPTCTGNMIDPTPRGIFAWFKAKFWSPKQ